MEEIDFKLTAKNSSGEQTLFLVHEDDEYFFTLVGEHNGRTIQLDFDEMTRGQLEDLIVAIQLILDAT